MLVFLYNFPPPGQLLTGNSHPDNSQLGQFHFGQFSPPIVQSPGEEGGVVLSPSFLFCRFPGARDYVHVLDLAAGHVAAINKVKEQCGLKIYNLGTGTSYTVLEMIKAFEEVIGKKVSLIKKM